MTTPHDGNNPGSSGGYGHPQGWPAQPEGGAGQYGGPQGWPQQQSQLPALTEDMLISKPPSGGGGWFRNPFARKKAEQPAPPNPWVTGPRQQPYAGPQDNVPRPAAAPPLAEAARYGSDGGAGYAGADPVNMKKGKQKAAQQAVEKSGKPSRTSSGKSSGGDEGNGWFRNPFAKSSSGKRPGGVSPAQNWAGPRRGILLRRVLGVLGVVLLLFLTIKINGKANKADVAALVEQKVRAAEVSFPRGAAVMWAAPLVKAFGTYDPDQAQQRAQALSPYIANGLDGQLGWNGQGKQSVIDMVMSSDVQITDPSRGVVHSTVQIQDGSWRCVAVPLFLVKRGDTTAFGLTSAPVYEPCSGLTTPPQAASQSASNDSTLADTFKSQLLPPFLAAWAQGDAQNLARYMLPGVTSVGLGGAYTGSGADGRPVIGDVFVPLPAKGDPGDRRTLTFTVTFLGLDRKAAQTSTYEVAVAQRSGQWYFAADPVPAVDAHAVGGDQVPDVQPTQGTGSMYSQSPAPFPPGSSRSPHSSSPTASGAP